MDLEKQDKMFENITVLTERQTAIKDIVERVEKSVDDIKSRGCNKRPEDTNRMTAIEGDLKLLTDKSATNRALLWIVLVSLLGMCITIISMPIIKGIRGETGVQGEIGVQGKTGETGVQGETGVRGIQGIRGDYGTRDR